MATALTKAELAKRLSQDIGLNSREAKSLVDSFFGEVIAVLEAGVAVKLSSFGNLDLRDKNQRPDRRPGKNHLLYSAARGDLRAG